MGALAFRVTALAIGAALWSSQALAQASHAHGAGTSEVLGELSFPNSGNGAAQEPFLRGVKLLHNFQYEQAIEAFRAAQKADPTFALAYWGEAMSHNYSLWAEQHVDQAHAALSKLAADPAARAAKAGTKREAMYLEAVEVLYGEGSKFERDIAYADKMDALAKAFPDDVEAQAFAALATLGRSHGTRNIANYEKAGAMLEPLFQRYPEHPGVAHYLIHSYDDPDHAQRALAAARVYDKLASDSVHALHMTSHIYLSLGMWPEVEQANLAARKTAEKQEGQPGSVPCGHTNIWLVYARLQQSLPVEEQLAECRTFAANTIKESKDIPVVGYLEGNSGSVADMAVRRGIETGKWDTPLAVPDGKLNYTRFLYAYGRVLASRRDPAGAEAGLAEMRAAHRMLAENYRKEFPDDDQAMPWLDLELAQAEAVGQLAAGHSGEGLQSLEAVARRESALPSMFGPPILLKPSWELLGDERLAAGDKVGAAAAYKESLRLQPGRRLSVAGLAAATR
jgi:hypothetical protein